jgi:hypothetical protein
MFMKTTISYSQSKHDLLEELYHSLRVDYPELNNFEGFSDFKSTLEDYPVQAYEDWRLTRMDEKEGFSKSNAKLVQFEDKSTLDSCPFPTIKASEFLKT